MHKLKFNEISNLLSVRRAQTVLADYTVIYYQKPSHRALMITRALILLLLSLVGSSLQAKEPFKIVYFNDFPPYSFQGPQQMQGIYVDILHEALANRMKINVSHQGFPWARAQANVKSGKADAFITTPTKQRIIYTNVSEGVIQDTNHIFVRVSHPDLENLKKITSIQQLKDYKVVDYVGNGWATNVLKGMNVHWLARFEQIFPYLMKGRGDLHVTSRSMAAYNLKKMGYKGKIIGLKPVLASLYVHLCINKKSAYAGILKDFNKTIRISL